MIQNRHRPIYEKLCYAIMGWFTREAFILLVYMAVSASVLNIFMQTRSLKETSAEFSISKMMDGSAYLPYVYRQLVPIIANYAVKLIHPEEQTEFVEDNLNKYHLRQFYFGKSKEVLDYNYIIQDNWSPDYAIKYHIVYIIVFLSLLGTLYCLRGLIPAILISNNPLTPFLPIIFVLLIPLSFMHGNFFYDFLEFFFLSVLLLSSIKGCYAWWLLLLPLAVLNKESNIIVPLLYAPVIIANSLHWRSRIFIAIGFLISITVFLFIKQKYNMNLGNPFIWQLEPKVIFLLNPENYFLWSDFYAPMIPFPRGFNIFLLIVLAKLLFWQWKKKPHFAKKLFFIALIINIPLFIFLCQTDEIRNLSFLFLPIYLLSVHTLLTTEFQKTT